jgi:hypothetical protein
MLVGFRNISNNSKQLDIRPFRNYTQRRWSTHIHTQRTTNKQLQNTQMQTICFTTGVDKGLTRSKECSNIYFYWSSDIQLIILSLSDIKSLTNIIYCDVLAGNV